MRADSNESENYNDRNDKNKNGNNNETNSNSYTDNDHKRIIKFVMITKATVKIIVIPCMITRVTVIITKKVTEK